ncbi:MAG: acyl-CoA dehydrogenase, partial [Planctomycetales bacterium]
LTAKPESHGDLLDGYWPWITGAPHCDYFVIGAELEDGRQLLAAVPADLPGVECGPPARLVSLTSSLTGPVHFHNVLLNERWLLAKPVENVMAQGRGANTGGLETSSMAIGSAAASIRFLEQESGARPALEPAAASFREDHRRLEKTLLKMADGEEVCSNQELRVEANSLVLRSSQAALTAAKGAGYVLGHPAARWCREALFFLVWSCPHPVSQAALCELAMIQD